VTLGCKDEVLCILRLSIESTDAWDDVAIVKFERFMANVDLLALE
jgi:hypothetical protein